MRASPWRQARRPQRRASPARKRRACPGAWRRAGRRAWTRFTAARNSSPSGSRRRPAASSRSRCSPPARSSPALQVLDAVQNGTVECGHTAPYYFFGKDPTFAFACAIPFGLNARQQNAWMYHGGGLELMREFFKELQHAINFPAGNTGAQMGGWFRKEIKTVADLKGLKMRIGGTAGLVLAKLGVVPQQHRRRRHLPGAGKGHDRRGGVGRALRRREARLLQGREVLLLPGWWEGGPSSTCSSTSRRGRRCRRTTRRSSRPRAPRRTTGCWPSTTR